MFGRWSTKEGFATLGAGLLALVVAGYVGAQRMRRPAEIALQPGPPVPGSPATDAPPTPPPPPASEVVVDVQGAVGRPGIVRLPSGARVADAIARAGGAKPSASTQALNLAAKLVDGTQIYVPTKAPPKPAESAPTEPPPPVAEPYRGGPFESTSYDAAPKAERRRPATRSGKKAPSGPVSLNSATSAQLQTLPGVGPATAERILAYRKERGGFSSTDELMAVKGIGPKKLAKMKPYLRL